MKNCRINSSKSFLIYYPSDRTSLFLFLWFLILFVLNFSKSWPKCNMQHATQVSWFPCSETTFWIGRHRPANPKWFRAVTLRMVPSWYVHAFLNLPKAVECTVSRVSHDAGCLQVSQVERTCPSGDADGEGGCGGGRGRRSVGKLRTFLSILLWP